MTRESEKVSFMRRGDLSKDLKGVSELAMRIFREEGSGLKNGKCKSLRQELARHVRGQARRPRVGAGGGGAC